MVDIKNSVDLNGNLKVFILFFIISLILIVFYILVRPDESRKINFSAFPVTGPNVPYDSSACGRDIIECSSDSSICDSDCNSVNYTCKQISPGKEVWYLGSKLEPTKSYCLPKQNISKIDSCNTFSGKMLWSEGKWVCQCKYPNLFGGSDCENQVACKIENSNINTSDVKFTNLIRLNPDGSPYLLNGNKVIWNPSRNYQMSLLAQGDNPLDIYDNKNPKYQCDCSEKGNLNFKDDPYRCHANICYAGNVRDVSTTAIYDTNTNKCICDNKYNVKSNITGFCYPLDIQSVQGISSDCNPDLSTGNCTCGVYFYDSDSNGTRGFFFNYNSNIYIIYYIKSEDIAYKVDITNIKLQVLNGDLITLLKAVPLPDVKGTIIEFSVMQHTNKNVDFTNDDFIKYVTDSYNNMKGGPTVDYLSLVRYKQKVNDKVSAGKTKDNVSIAIPCDSYFYSRPNDYGCPSKGCIKCSDSYYAAGDNNNKNGTICYNILRGKTCGGDNSVSILDVFDTTGEGYYCQCNEEQSYPKDYIQDGHTIHQCISCQKLQGADCTSDEECMPCHHCNKVFGRGGATTGKQCGGELCVIM